LVATLAAYRDLAGPWKDLLDYYQDFAEARTKFDVVVRQFNPEEMWRTEAQGGQPKEVSHLRGPIEAVDLGYLDDDGRIVLDNVNFRFEQGEKINILSSNSNTRDVIAAILSRLDLPTRGSLQFAGLEARAIHQSIAGIRIAQLGSQPAFFNTTIGENLFLALSSPLEADLS
jgi:ABC-type transport system involved in cytochrome bd biosynthesis fused ATPase/permease subunit